jgi:hypothetical protein
MKEVCMFTIRFVKLVAPALMACATACAGSASEGAGTGAPAPEGDAASGTPVNEPSGPAVDPGTTGSPATGSASPAIADSGGPAVVDAASAPPLADSGAVDSASPPAPDAAVPPPPDASPGCGSTAVSWQQAQPAWNFNASTAGTYGCSATLPAAPSGNTVIVPTTSSTRTGTATYTCNAGAWAFEGSTCDGAVVDLPPSAVVCQSADPVTSMFIGFYAKYLYRCADTAGLAYWVGNFHGSTPPCAADDTDPAAVGCWEMVFEGGSQEVAEASGAGHIAPNAEKALCGTTAGYPWSTSASFIAMVGAQCKDVP